MLNQKKLKELLNYDHETGIFTWKVRRGGTVKASSVAGSRYNCGYWRIQISGKMYLAHRLAWLWMHGYFPPEEIDHINHDRVDNRIKNLRVVSRSENARNRLISCNNTSGINGVHWHKYKKLWRAMISLNGKQHHIGYFDNIEDAIAARKKAEREHGFHPNHGTP